MNQEHSDASHQSPSSSAPSFSKKTPSSDTAFPSIAVMGMCLALIIALVGITGWKVIGLEAERAGVQRERDALERDKNDFEQKSKALPGLRQNYEELTASVMKLEGTQKELRQTLDKMTKQRQTLVEEAAKLSGDNTELTSRMNAVRKELGQAQSELANARPLAAVAKQELTALQSQETSLRASISEKQKQFASLTADIQGLERSRAHTQDLLDLMMKDQKVLEGFKKTIEAMTSQLQASLAKADSASNEYARHAAHVQTTTRNLDAEVPTMKNRLQEMGNHLVSLEQYRAEFLAMVAQGGNVSKALQDQVKTLTEKNNQLATTLRVLDEPIKLWTQRSQELLIKVQTMEERILPLANTLAKAAETVATQAKTLESQVGGLQTGVSGFQNSVRSLEQQALALATATTDIQSGARFSKDNSESLSQMISKLRQDLETLSATLQAIQSQKQKHPADNQ